MTLVFFALEDTLTSTGSGGHGLRAARGSIYGQMENTPERDFMRNKCGWYRGYFRCRVCALVTRINNRPEV